MVQFPQGSPINPSRESGEIEHSVPDKPSNPMVKYLAGQWIVRASKEEAVGKDYDIKLIKGNLALESHVSRDTLLTHLMQGEVFEGGTREEYVGKLQDFFKELKSLPIEGDKLKRESAILEFSRFLSRIEGKFSDVKEFGLLQKSVEVWALEPLVVSDEAEGSSGSLDETCCKLGGKLQEVEGVSVAKILVTEGSRHSISVDGNLYNTEGYVERVKGMKEQGIPDKDITKLSTFLGQTMKNQVHSFLEVDCMTSKGTMCKPVAIDRSIPMVVAQTTKDELVVVAHTIAKEFDTSNGIEECELVNYHARSAVMIFDRETGECKSQKYIDHGTIPVEKGVVFSVTDPPSESDLIVGGAFADKLNNLAYLDKIIHLQV